LNLKSSIPEGRAPLSAPRRYYPGFFGALFLILLRTAIGWHFAHEGWSKIRPTRKDAASFSAEGYLRNAVGPLAPQYRSLIPDPFALDRLDDGRLKARWRGDLAKIADHYKFADAQRQDAQKALLDTEKKADAWFKDGDNVRKVFQYREDVKRLERLEKAPPELTFEQERADETRKKIEAARREFVNTLDGWSGALRESWLKLATAEQRDADGPVPATWTSLDWVNWQTKYGLIAIGACLMLGLLTPLAALAAAGFLGMIYLSMPPWPGLPEGALVEGHYLYVNKNLIEMLACLALASTPSGLWLGLDALLFGWIGRRGRADAAADAEEAAAPARPAKNFRSL